MEEFVFALKMLWGVKDGLIAKKVDETLASENIDSNQLQRRN
jgi:hypothetical protein